MQSRRLSGRTALRMRFWGERREDPQQSVSLAPRKKERPCQRTGQGNTSVATKVSTRKARPHWLLDAQYWNVGRASNLP